MSKFTSATSRLSKEDAARLLGDSSGMLLQEDDNEISIGFVDFEVSMFGGRDYECFYILKKENADLFREALAKQYTGDLFEQCTQAFTIKFSCTRFEKFCDDLGIKYILNTYR